MPYFDQSPFDVTCEWGPEAIEALAAPDVLVIVDVLSFTTSVEVAVARGATILPYRWRDERAARYAAERNALLASPQRWAKKELSLAPSSLASASPGLRLVLPSPNGSELAFRARARGVTVLAGSLRNARAVARAASRRGRRIAVVCAGERWPDASLRPAVEDLLGAGAIIEHLPGTLSPEAMAARAAFRDGAERLLDRLLTCSSGRELSDRGFADDVEIAAQLDVSECVPILVDEAFVAERR
jgi:2-phosphosulfolactate phosphatase